MPVRAGSVRVRTTAAAGLVVGVALVVASIAMVVLLDRSLTSIARDAAIGRTELVVASLVAGEEPAFDTAEADEELVQVIGADGSVEASSSNVAGDPPIASVGPGDEVRLPDAGPEGVPILVVAARGPDSRTVLVGRSLEDADEAVAAARSLLVIGVPPLVLVVAVVTWWITGRALAPVDAMRGQVETISAGDLDRRVLEPGTGDEIDRLATTMNGMLGRLEAAQARQRRFVADAAHELRSPVAAIRQHSEVVIAHPTSATSRELAQVVHGENLRIERLVDDLLLLARLDEHRTGRSPASIELASLVEEACARAGAVRAGGVTIEQDTRDVEARVTGETADLERALDNVLANAVRHARGKVAVGLAVDGSSAVLLVDDDGPGVPTPERERVFDRFVRLDDARARDDGGAGLGLAIVRAVVVSHGGEVEIGDAPIGGARVRVQLPLARV